MIRVKLWQEEETINCTHSLAVRVVNGQEHKVLVNDEADQQRLQPVDVHLSADRLHVDELAEDGVGQLDVEGGRDETAVCQNHLEVVAGLGEDRSSVERVD